MIMVTAATGEFGRLVVDQLLERVPASDVAVAVRFIPKAADLADRGPECRRCGAGNQDQLEESYGFTGRRDVPGVGRGALRGLRPNDHPGSSNTRLMISSGSSGTPARASEPPYPLR